MPLFKSKSAASNGSQTSATPSPSQSPNLGPKGSNMARIDSNLSLAESDFHRSRSMSQRFKNLFVHDDESNSSVSFGASSSNLLKKNGNNVGLPPLHLGSNLPIPDRGQPAKHFVHTEDHSDADQPSSYVPQPKPQQQPQAQPRMRSKTLSQRPPNAAHGLEIDTNGLQELRHSRTVNYSTAHSHNQRDKIIKLKNNRVSLYDYGRSHEHDYYKFRTQIVKSNTALFGWMKRKEEDDDTFKSLEQSVSLLPDKYSRELIVLKNNPKNVIWNYDDDDEPQEFDQSVQSPVLTVPDIHVNNESDDELDKVRKKHGIEDPLKNIQRRKSFTSGSYKNTTEEDDSEDDDGDEDDDDDDDFDDVIDNMMIEPIIGTEQVYLIDTVMDKIVHSEKFVKSIEARRKSGKFKKSLASKYGEIVGVAGKGSYGTVCISKKEIPNREPVYFAIKQLQQKSNETLKHFGTRVASEFMISSSLTHQAIINVYDLMFDANTKIYSQVMEFIPCGDLYSLIYHTKGLDIVESDCFFKQILNAVTYLHSVGISHNDLKVENLLLTRKGQLKIIDFGTSAVFRTQWESDIQLSKGACGSERYIAPEQFIESKEYDPRLGDVWALGIIYLVMIYGHYSWETAKKSDDGYRQFMEQRARYDYNLKDPNKMHQFKCTKRPLYGPIEGIKGGLLSVWIQNGGEVIPTGCDCEPCIDRILSPNNIIGMGGVEAVANKHDFNSPMTPRDNQKIRLFHKMKATPESINDSRRYVLYNILNPDPQFRMRTYQIWQSEWIRETKICDAGRGYISYENYLEMTMKSVKAASERDLNESSSSPPPTQQKKKHGLFGL